MIAFFKIATWLSVLVLSASLGFSQAPFASTCGEDAHIQASKRNAVDSVAMDFVRAMLSSTPSDVYDLMSKAGQAEATPQQFDAVVRGIVKQFDPKNITMQHTYLLHLKGNSPGRVVCATDLSKPDGWESVTAASVPEQAYAVMSADTRNNKLVFVVWLVPEQGRWKVQSFHVNISSLADQDSIQLWELAHQQQARGHTFNAALLYAAAAQTANRGPNFQLGIEQSISGDISKLAAPAEVSGQPPFWWKDGGTTYKVLSVGPIAVGGKTYVIIAHEVSPWQNNEQVDGWNKQLLRYFKSRFPEYSDFFAGTVVRAIERGSNRGYGTVDELASGK